MKDLRAEAAYYYDLNPHCPDDTAFYASKIPFPEANLLELGCGTGRVLLPLTRCCGYIHGIDNSETMLDYCAKKLFDAGVPPSKAVVERGDITDFDLRRTFYLFMRCYYPEDFDKIIREHGFTIVNRWGGYAGEVYGKGSELVVQFKEGT